MARANKKYVQLSITDTELLKLVYLDGCKGHTPVSAVDTRIIRALNEVLDLARENGNQTVCLAYAVVRDRRKGLGRPGTTGKEKG